MFYQTTKQSFRIVLPSDTLCFLSPVPFFPADDVTDGPYFQGSDDEQSKNDSTKSDNDNSGGGGSWTQRVSRWFTSSVRLKKQNSFYKSEFFFL